ncbi:MAG TPA: carboxypeptidase regulatory-like domain-containing protein [Planctomycetaceae bacterium]|nr:carboxypeptidase regulatory-like domain-containing protein [Planctomycetaceae bacterium]HIQ22332.1 carboxypeptidase regulatory-like domain-containing protein [Planctomycetota bacterium]
MRIVRKVCVLAVALCVLVGCAEEGPQVVPVTGVVTYQGKPVEGARVMFHPLEGGARSSHGTTDAEGRFELSTFGMNDGALVGRHVVTISKVDLPEEGTAVDVEALQKGGYAAGGMPGYEKMMGPGAGGRGTQPKSELPPKYADRKASGIEVEVTVDGENEFTFNLK